MRRWPLPEDAANANLNTATLDRRGRIWLSYWNTGQVGMHDPAKRAWREWKLPDGKPNAYSVWVDDQDKVRPPDLTDPSFGVR